MGLNDQHRKQLDAQYRSFYKDARTSLNQIKKDETRYFSCTPRSVSASQIALCGGGHVSIADLMTVFTGEESRVAEMAKRYGLHVQYACRPNAKQTNCKTEYADVLNAFQSAVFVPPDSHTAKVLVKKPTVIVYQGYSRHHFAHEFILFTQYLHTNKRTREAISSRLFTLAKRINYRKDLGTLAKSVREDLWYLGDWQQFQDQREAAWVLGIIYVNIPAGSLEYGKWLFDLQGLYGRMPARYQNSVLKAQVINAWDRYVESLLKNLAKGNKTLNDEIKRTEDWSWKISRASLSPPVALDRFCKSNGKETRYCKVKVQYDSHLARYKEGKSNWDTYIRQAGNFILHTKLFNARYGKN
jgi:hypothetical protein